MEPDEILANIEEAEGERDAMIAVVIALALASYRSALTSLVSDLSGSLTKSADPEAALALAAQLRLATLRRDAAFRGVWNDWQGGMETLDRAIRRSLNPVGRVPAATETEAALIRAAFGSWPTALTDGSGLAGRLYALSLRDRTELADIVVRGLLGQADKQTLVRELAQRLERSVSDAERLFHDGTFQYVRRAVDQRARAAGIEQFYYAGPSDSKNRPFCRSLIQQGRIFSRDEIDSMDNGQTPAGTVMYACGGFRCRHIFRPVDTSWGLEPLLNTASNG